MQIISISYNIKGDYIKKLIGNTPMIKIIEKLI